MDRVWFLRTISAIHIGQLKPEQVNVLARPRALIFPSLARKHAHGYPHVYPFAAHAHTHTHALTHRHTRNTRTSGHQGALLSLSKGVYCSKMLRRTDSVPSAFFCSLPRANNAGSTTYSDREGSRSLRFKNSAQSAMVRCKSGRVMFSNGCCDFTFSRCQTVLRRNGHTGCFAISRWPRGYRRRYPDRDRFTHR